MSKFTSQYGKTQKLGKSPVQSTKERTVNHGGAAAFVREEKSDLFLLGVSNFVGENAYYEAGQTRDERFKTLVRNVTEADPDWVARFIPWLRNEANMRSASLVAAVEYGRAGGPDRRKVLDSAMSRADEPAEALSYWIGTYGKPIPSWMKRGVADATNRLYNEYSVGKYDGNSKDMRFADVIQLSHAKPKDERQSALFKYTLDSRYGNTPSTDGLPMLSYQQLIRKGHVTRGELLENPEAMKKAGLTWEFFSGLGQMDAQAWEAMIPTMGYMALLRNLRNFEQAGISAETTDFVINKLKDPEQVARSRQLPYRFYSAYKNVAGLQWGWALEQALGHSLKNLPAFGGRTLILTDTSGSMESNMSGKSQMTYLEASALFASALALKGEDVDFYGFADGVLKVNLSKGGSVLKTVEKIRKDVGKVGYGTNLYGALGQFDGHDRVIVFSDMQTLGRYGSRDGLSQGTGNYTSRYGGYNAFNSYYGSRAVGHNVQVKSNSIPKHVPIFAFNLGGYGGSLVDSTKNEYELGGLTDHTFKLLPILEKRAAGEWPF